MGDADTRALVRRLVEYPEQLPPELESDILARGAEAVEPLLELLWDESLAHGPAPFHAVRLLVRLKAPEALKPLVKRLLCTGLGEALYEELFDGLEVFGPAVVPVALEALANTRDANERFSLFSLLASCGEKDERIYTALLEELREDPEHGAMDLALYGDPRAIEPLKRALEAYPVDESEGDLFALHAVVELEGAIEELGGTLDAAQREKVEQAARARERLGLEFLSLLLKGEEQEEEDEEWLPTPAVRPERPGRNEPCWCGSGVKYKKCHLGEDRR
jgi:hypothetical protein